MSGSPLEAVAQATEPFEHEAAYEWDGMWTAVRCSCDDFYRICESREVAEREFANHVRWVSSWTSGSDQ